MNYSDYFDKFCENDCEEVVQYVPNKDCKAFLLENAPRLYCPDETIQETFAFRTWTMRKHIKKTDVGFVLTEFLTKEQLSWAGEYNTINAPLTHHLNEFRWLKNSNIILDYVNFFINGKGSVDYSKSAFAYHTPALTAIYDFCVATANEQFLLDNALSLEKYFLYWEQTHLTENGLYWSIDDREGTEYSISGTTPDIKFLKGFRPILNSSMYGDAVSLSKIFSRLGDKEKQEVYRKKADFVREKINQKMWDGEFYKAIHPLDQNLDASLDYNDIPKDLDVREIMGFVPWAYHVPEQGWDKAFGLLKDEKVFKGATGFTTADISHPRFLFRQDVKACLWNGNVWPFATSFTINAVIELLNHYEQQTLTEQDLYDFIKQYAQMHYSEENGKTINFIDEVMYPFERVWRTRDWVKRGNNLVGGNNRGRDYNHSTFIDLVLRGLCGIDVGGESLTSSPKIKGIWKWFKLENITYRQKTYNVYYDEDGSVFGKGVGVVIEKVKG